jgi:putative membrane protein
MTTGHALAVVNASLNATSFVLLLNGYLAIRAGNRERHKKLMVATFFASSLFLITYLIRWAVTGTLLFQGQGPVRALYFLILFTHIPLAISVVPLSIRAIYLAWNKRFREHTRVTRWLYPIWTYVSITGVIVYFMLYHLYPQPSVVALATP